MAEMNTSYLSERRVGTKPTYEMQLYDQLKKIIPEERIKSEFPAFYDRVFHPKPQENMTLYGLVSLVLSDDEILKLMPQVWFSEHSGLREYDIIPQVDGPSGLVVFDLSLRPSPRQ